MVTNDMKNEAVRSLNEFWPESATRVIEECARVSQFEGDSKEFLAHCTACGGNWGGMLLTGINELWPEVWEAIPDDMGVFAWQALCSVLILCGVDTSR